jgi:hypothetical protein
MSTSRTVACSMVERRAAFVVGSPSRLDVARVVVVT